MPLNTYILSLLKVRADIAQNWKKLTPEERHQWMLSNMNEISTSIIGEDKANGGNLLSHCHVASFSKVGSSFSIDQQEIVKEIGFGSLL